MANNPIAVSIAINNFILPFYQRTKSPRQRRGLFHVPWGRIGNMGEPKKESGWLIVTALIAAAVLLPSWAYVSGYFALSQIREFRKPDGGTVIFEDRAFDYHWQKVAYTPMLEVEKRIRGKSFRGGIVDPRPPSP